MHHGNVVLMLVYEPAFAASGPVPIARVSNDVLAAAVAESAVAEAEVRAREIATRDEFLGEIEQADVRRLRELLSLLVPGFRDRKKSRTAKQSLM